jgi:hypothetical protein
MTDIEKLTSLREAMEEEARGASNHDPRRQTVTALLIRTVEPTQRLGFTLLDAARRYRRHFEERSRELALDYAQCRALITLAENKGVTQRRLADPASGYPW